MRLYQLQGIDGSRRIGCECVRAGGRGRLGKGGERARSCRVRRIENIGEGIVANDLFVPIARGSRSLGNDVDGVHDRPPVETASAFEGSGVGGKRSVSWLSKIGRASCRERVCQYV